MFQRFHEMRERREDGFTLIELLVVILIVAILAAVAIPVFLRQREKGYKDQMQSALKNAATAMESLGVDNNGDVSGAAGEVCDEDDLTACPELEDQGFKGTAGVTLTVATATDQGAYCLEAEHASTDIVYAYDSATGSPEEDATCAAPPAP